MHGAKFTSYSYTVYCLGRLLAKRRQGKRRRERRGRKEGKERKVSGKPPEFRRRLELELEAGLIRRYGADARTTPCIVRMHASCIVGAELALADGWVLSWATQHSLVRPPDIHTSLHSYTCIIHAA